MAFYGDYSNKKSKEEKRKSAEMRGGFEDEGTRYTDSARSGKGASEYRGGGEYRGGRPGGFAQGRKPGQGQPSAQDRAPNGGNFRNGRNFASRDGHEGGRPGGNAPYGNASRSAAPRGDAPRGNAPRGDAPYGNAPRGNAPYGNAPRGNAPRGNALRSDAPRSAAPRGNALRSAAPRGDAPRSDAPRENAPYGAPSGSRGNRGPGGGQGRPFAKSAPEGRGNGSFAKSGNHEPRPYAPGNGGKKSGFRKGENNLRFARDPGQRYSERGAGITPRPYGEQRDARRDSAGSYHGFQYAPKPLEAFESAQDRDLLGMPSPMGSEQFPPENLLSGRNPIREALKSGRDIEKLLVARGELSGSAREIVQIAKERHIPVQEVDRIRLDAITHNHQGMLAFASAHEYRTVQDMLDLAKSREEAPFLVLLDGITDPHNLGAIIRSAECAGAHGIIVQERRAVGLTPAAVKASAGAVEYLPVARVINLTNTLLELKAQGIWAYAADMVGEDYSKVDFSGPLALVIGAEGEGVSKRVLDTCDKRVSLPIRGQIDSLNASVAAGVLLYAAMQAR